MRIESVEQLVAHLRATGDVLWAPEPALNEAPARSLPADVARDGSWLLRRAVPGHGDDARDGLVGEATELNVSDNLWKEISAQIQDPSSDVRRSSNRPIDRAFVFVDVSDFSKLASGVQLLVVQALIRLAAGVQKALPKLPHAEAQLCIGDGYIYVFKSAVAATFFASTLALSIEHAVAGGAEPDFHFRIGVHAGPVRCFWDPGRNNWNYVGDGINGAQRVLSAIGKETDDVVYVSAQVRQQILRSPWSDEVLATLDNKGRKADKHGNAWRVYQVSHTSLYPANYSEEAEGMPSRP